MESADDEAAEDLIRESDRRVNAALASPLASTLDPFREPLPSSLTGSMSSSGSSALVLSFPDPLTPSQELQAAALASQPTATSPDIDIVETRPTEKALPSEDVALTTVNDEAQAETPIQANDGLAADAQSAANTGAIVVEETNARDLRKIASYIPRKQSLNKRPVRRVSDDIVPLLLQGPPVSHSWSTSM